MLTKPAKGQKKAELRIIFEEICFVSKVQPEDVIKYLQFLEDRVDEVENVIDHHFDLIRQHLIDSKRDKMVKAYEKMKKNNPDQVHNDEAELKMIEDNL